MSLIFVFFKVGDYVYEKMLYCIQPFSCTAKVGTFNAICLVLTKEMTQIWHLWQDLLKSTSENLAIIWWLDSGNSLEGISHIVMEGLNLWQILAKVLAFKPKESQQQTDLKSAW